ncbi:type III-B CRISPR module RAMP protein Cmr4 [Geitlerinema sp. P-1104]|uniref:RAMP superfamily CRISPR-associated protein n=1 Tax=Geitlerinema sp. P-1104 TaxID=2546230 RepID=UPI001476E5DB|nr:RAMP superfamily CRISPR-associated protein [Geitlerinema sp. P-1104]NMG59500.1 type III-B CRISPR module RAMP protein Cmr4 [Geitlerinema sp. P-1104]
MYHKAYGIIETLSPLHVGATAGEESGNLNLIFRDQFTQTGIIPGSSIRGRFRAEMRRRDSDQANHWYGHEAEPGVRDSTTESLVKFEYASIIWLPVFCPGQPVVWVSCPRLLNRYKRISGISDEVPDPYVASHALHAPQIQGQSKLFFNFGFLQIGQKTHLTPWFPDGKERPAVIVADDEMGMIHDMALYRQSRVKLSNDEKKVEGGAFFNTEALPESTLLIFPMALRNEDDKDQWHPFGPNRQNEDELYLGGLESIGFGHCAITLNR